MGVTPDGVTKQPYILEHYKDFEDARKATRSPMRAIRNKDIVDPDGGVHRYDFMGGSKSKNGDEGPRLIKKGLFNTVSVPEVEVSERDVEFKEIPGAGNVFFPHDVRDLGQRIFDIDEKYPGVDGLEDANIKVVAQMLHEHPQLKVKLSGFADRSGNDEYNKQLSADRCDVVFEAIKKEYIAIAVANAEDLKKAEAAEYAARVFDQKRDTDIREQTGYEENTRIFTDDGVKEGVEGQINRSVLIEYTSANMIPVTEQVIEAHKHHDRDNHSHMVVFPAFEDELHRGRKNPPPERTVFLAPRHSHVPRGSGSFEDDEYMLPDQNPHIIFQAEAGSEVVVNLKGVNLTPINDETPAATVVLEMDNPENLSLSYNQQTNEILLHNVADNSKLTVRLDQGADPNMFAFGAINQDGLVNVLPNPAAGFEQDSTLDKRAVNLPLVARIESFQADLVDVVRDANKADMSQETSDALRPRIHEAFNHLRTAGVNPAVIEVYEKYMVQKYANTDVTSEFYKPGEGLLAGAAIINLASFSYDLSEGPNLENIPDKVHEAVGVIMKGVNMDDVSQNSELYQGLAIVVASIHSDMHVSDAFNNKAHDGGIVDPTKELNKIPTPDNN